MTRKQAHRVRMRDMSDDERHKRIGARKHHTHKIVKPTSVIRRDTATKPRVAGSSALSRASNSMEVLEHKEAPPVENKRRSRRSRRREPDLKQQGNWVEVTQAGCTFWVNDTTGIADEEPPPIRKPDGTFQKREHSVAQLHVAEEVVDDESIGDNSFAFLDDWSKEKKRPNW